MQVLRRPTVIASVFAGIVLLWAVVVAPQVWPLLLPWAICGAAAAGQARYAAAQTRSSSER